MLISTPFPIQRPFLGMFSLTICGRSLADSVMQAGLAARQWTGYLLRAMWYPDSETPDAWGWAKNSSLRFALPFFYLCR